MDGPASAMQVDFDNSFMSWPNCFCELSYRLGFFQSGVRFHPYASEESGDHVFETLGELPLP